jgi:hypothetical protein
MTRCHIHYILFLNILKNREVQIVHYLQKTCPDFLKLKVAHKNVNFIDHIIIIFSIGLLVLNRIVLVIEISHIKESLQHLQLMCYII